MNIYERYSEEELALLCLTLKDDDTETAKADLAEIFKFADSKYPDFIGTMERLKDNL